MEKRIPITSLQCIELLTLATRLTPDEFEKRRNWLVLLTNPEFDITQFPRVIEEAYAAKESDAEDQSEPEAPQLPQYPPIGQVFSMTMDGDAPENDPDQMARSNDHGDLKYKGSNKVEGRVTKDFKFVEIGDQLSFADVTTELAKRGKIPEGQWREAVKKKFCTNGRRMGIADASWVNTVGFAYFPFIHSHSGSGFCRSDPAFLEDWLWLIEVE